MSLYIVAMGAGVEDIQSVKARYVSELMARPGVVSVGIGLNKDGQPAIIIGIEREDDALEQSLPKALEGHPVEIQILGTIKDL